MTHDPVTPPDDTMPATPAVAVAHPEQPPMDDAASDIKVKDEAAQLGDFA